MPAWLLIAAATTSLILTLVIGGFVAGWVLGARFVMAEAEAALIENQGESVGEMRELRDYLQEHFEGPRMRPRWQRRLGIEAAP